MARRGTWATRFGIYFAAIGSAFGLGGLWRFPFVVEDNGGGAFVTLYFFLLATIGVPLLVGELLIGKVTRRGVLAGQKQLVAQAQSRGLGDRYHPLLKIMPILASISLICCVMILGYYSVVSGWVLHFMLEFARLPIAGENSSQVMQAMGELRKSGLTQMLLSTAHLAATIIVVAKGVEDGIEKWVGFIMPLFVGILSVLVYRALSLPSSLEALQFYLYPDFSRLTYNSLGAAIGQLCFTLSIGFATMATFGSYLRDSSLVPATGFRVATLDATTAFIAGLLIFPLVIGAASDTSGPELLFTTVPQFLLSIEGGELFGILFFLCLYLAAFGASISILETIVANICENSKLTRGVASIWAGLAAISASILPALSSSVFVDFNWRGKGILELLDLVLINWVVPILALIYSQVVVYEVNEKSKKEEFIQPDDSYGDIVYNHWRILMKYVVPPVIILALILQTYALFIKN